MALLIVIARMRRSMILPLLLVLVLVAMDTNIIRSGGIRMRMRILVHV
jgi:hypothetical protein